MSIELTSLSAAEYENIVYGNMTPAMAADLIPRLTDFFLTVTQDASPQSVSKKIRNWTSGKNRPSNRDDIFRITSALQLSEQQLNYLLCLSTDYCIQYRDNREIILAWFLRNGYSYQNAMQFYFSLPPIQERNLARTKHTSRLTHEMRAEFQVISTLDDLRNCYIKNLSNFGAIHLRAYYYFDKFLNQLIHPTPCWESNIEPDYSLESVMNTYLSLNVPSGKKRKDYSIVQKLLKQNRPNATSIKNIRNHKEDVPRKLLLLLYVVTENETSDPDFYRKLDEDYMPLEFPAMRKNL